MMCNCDSGIGIGIGILGILSPLGWACITVMWSAPLGKSSEVSYGIGIGMESKAKISWWKLKGGIGIGIESKGFGPESELNPKQLLPELHIIGIQYPAFLIPTILVLFLSDANKGRNKKKYLRLCIWPPAGKQTYKQTYWSNNSRL